MNELYKIPIAVIGCGMAGMSHLAECAFHPDLDVIAVCSNGSGREQSCADLFGIPYRYISVKTCMEEIGSSIAVALFSVPPSSLADSLQSCIGRFAIVADKPGAFLDDTQLRDRTLFYYSRRSFSMFPDLLNQVDWATNNGGKIFYQTIGPYSKRYTVGETYLVQERKHGVIRDTLCHFFDLICASKASDSIQIQNVQKFGIPETQCNIELQLGNAQVLIETMDQTDRQESWLLHISSPSETGSKNFTIDNLAYERNYTISLANQLVNYVRRGEQGIFLDYKQNEKILKLIRDLYEY